MLMKLLIVISTFSLLCFGQECTTFRAGLGYQCIKKPSGEPTSLALEETLLCCGLANGVYMEDTQACYINENQDAYGTCCRDHSSKDVEGYVRMGQTDKNIGITKCKDGKVAFGDGCSFRLVPCGEKECAQPYNCPGDNSDHET